MAGLKIPYLLPQKRKGGIYYRWYGNKMLRDAGWTTINFGTDLATAINGAMARNAEVAAWKGGGIAPIAHIERHVQSHSIDQLIRRYTREHLAHESDNHRRNTGYILNVISRLFGDIGVDDLQPQHVHRWRDEMMGEGRYTGKPPSCAPHTAHNRLRTLRALYNWAMEPSQMIATNNPAIKFKLPMPAGRVELWEDDDIGAFTAAAIDLGYPSMAFAAELAAYTGQREMDLIHFTQHHWQAMAVTDPSLASRIEGKDQSIMGWLGKQRKTGAHISIPFDPIMRQKIEAQLRRNTAISRAKGQIITPVLINDASGTAWQQRHFIRTWRTILDHAITKTQRHSMAALQFRDLRRTCVVTLNRLGLNDAQISAISGHKLATIKQILEVYCPRDNIMAAGAIIARADHAAAALARKEGLRG